MYNIALLLTRQKNIFLSMVGAPFAPLEQKTTIKMGRISLSFAQSTSMIPTTIFYSDPLCRVIRKRRCEVDLHARTEPHSRHAIFFIHSGSQVKNIVLNIILYSTIKRILSFATRDQRWEILVHFSAQDLLPSIVNAPAVH